MAYREFRDQRDVLWYVWEIQPSSIERRVRDHETKRPTTERRRAPSARRFRPSNPQLLAGWLAFESSLGKRRLYPVPTEWEILLDDALMALLAAWTEVLQPILR